MTENNDSATNEKEKVIDEIISLAIRDYKNKLIEGTKNYGITKNPDGTTTHKLTLSFEGSVRNAIRSVGDNRFKEGLDSWGIKEACRMYLEGREAWLNGDFETVASLFGVLT